MPGRISVQVKTYNPVPVLRGVRQMGGIVLIPGRGVGGIEKKADQLRIPA